MKKAISMICIFCLLLTLVTPLAMPLEAKAAKDTGEIPWNKWSFIAGKADVAGDTLHFDGKGVFSHIQHKGTMIDNKYTVNFSMKLNNFSYPSTFTFQIFNGVRRAGFLFTQGEGYVRAIDNVQRINIPVDLKEWHDYTIEVDCTVGETGIQKLYIDGVYMGQTDIGGSGMASIEFYSEDVDVEISNFTYKSAYPVPEDMLELTSEYTEAFFQDFHEIGGWKVENDRFVTHYPEEGLIRLRTWGDEAQGYRSIERPLRPPANYDMEFRMKIAVPEVCDGQIATLVAQLSTDTRHSWLYIRHNKILINNNTDLEMVKDGPQDGIPYTIGHDFNVWRAEVRGDNITWYINDKEFISFKMLRSSRNIWHFVLYATGYQNQAMDMTLDWVKYTPYFEKELTMVSPEGGSDFLEDTDIQLKATPASDVDKIDYKINGVYVGSGYKKDNYVYTLKNARVGVYNVTANIQNIETTETTFYVKKAFDAEIKVDKEHIKLGEKVTLSVEDTVMLPKNHATKVEYYVNGKLAATSTKAPFKVTLSDLEVGGNSIYAKVSNGVGMTVNTESYNVHVDYVPGKTLNVGREYQIDYSYKTGTGNVELTDGYFKLALKHEADKLTYETFDKTEVYEGIGKGDYRVVVTSGHAEVYYNGHFLCSFFMPRSNEKVAFKNSGVADVELGSSKVKALVMEEKWSGKADYEYAAFPDITHYSVEFDKTDKSNEEFIFNDGTFVNKLSFRDDGIYANRILQMYADPTEIKLADTVEPGYYRLTIAFGIAQLYRDNQYVGSYRCEKRQGKTILKRTMSNPSASTIVSVKHTDDLYYHTDTFEDITELSYEDYWKVMPRHGTKNIDDELTATRMLDENGNHYMNLTGIGSYMLDGMPQDAHLKWRGMFDYTEGVFYIILRRSLGDRQTRLVYDFNKGEWSYQTLPMPGTGNFITESVKKAPNAFVEGEWYDFEVICDDFDTTLYCDGKEVFKHTMDNNKNAKCYGRVGFGIEDATFSFDDFEYVGENRVNAGQNVSLASQWGAYCTWDFYQDPDGVVQMGDAGYSCYTLDGGATWTKGGSTGGSMKNVVNMPDGTLVRVDDFGDTHASSFLSKDGGLTWDGPYRVQPFETPNGQYNSNARLTCTMDGRLFIVPVSYGSEDNGHQQVFYSDDGKEWHQSETTFTTANTGLIYNESTVIDAPNGDIIFFARSDSGFLDYHVSKDGGKTFDLTSHQSQIINLETCFNVRRDWDNPNTYYAMYAYDTSPYNEIAIQFPRCKNAISVSYDGMKTWQYLCDVIETDEWVDNHTSDIAMKVLDGVVYYRHSNVHGGDNNIGSVDLSKAKPLMRAPELHYRNHIGFNLKQDLAKDHCVLPKTDGDAWVYSNYLKAKVKDGMADVDIMANVFSVNATKTSNGIEFRMGDSVVKFTNNSDQYVINGETKTAEKVILKDGYLDIKTLCDIYGKVFRETEQSYSVLDKAPAIDYYQVQIDEFA